VPLLSENLSVWDELYAWPQPAGSGSAGPAGSSARCSGQRRRTARMRLPRRARVRSIHARLDGKRVRAVRHGRIVRVRVDLRRSTKPAVRLRVSIRLRDGKTLRRTRVYHPCPRP